MWVIVRAEGGRDGRLEWVTGSGFTETVVTIIEQNNIDINKEYGDERYTLLHIAAKNDFPDTANALIKKGANPDAQDEDRRTPLHCAIVLHRSAEMIRTLIEGKASVNATDQDGETPLHLAAASGRKEAVEVLLKAEGINVNAVDEEGRTPLHFAVMHRHEMVEVLLKAEGINVNAVDENETLLHLAAASGRKETVEVLLKAEGINVNAVDEEGRTPLHLAVLLHHKEVVEVLLKAEGINVNAKDNDENTPFNLTTDEEIKTLLKNAKESDDGSVGGSSEQHTPVEPSTPTQNSGGQTSTINVGEGTQTEEQPSSFFGSLFSILTKPFSLIASFFSGFFSWLLGSNGEKADESTSQSDADVSLDEEDSSGHYSAMNTDM